MMDRYSFDGRVAIVTGAGRGMGRAHALTLAARGASVVVCDAGVATDGSGWSAEPAESVVAEIKKAGGNAVVNTDDVRDVKSGENMVAAALEHFGRVDAVVANAGVLRINEFPDTTEADLATQIDTHIYGTYRLCRAAWPHMVASGYGRIVTVPSISTFGMPRLAGYNIAKGGILALTRTLALEGAPHGIVANGLAPAAWTRMSEQASDVAEELAYRFAKRATPTQANAAAIAYLAHESTTMTGQMIINSGSRMARLVYAETDGYEYDVDVDLTPEDIADNIEQIMNPDVFREWTHGDDLMQFSQAKLRESDARKSAAQA